jgi:hydroxymethylpyrimidine pyrophosphatase-like HAD family hydrolase
MAPYSPLICDMWLAQVKDVASYVTSSHDHDGVAEAIERFLL